MKVYIIRHAIAMDRDLSEPRGIAEADRPLTAEGKKKFAKHLRELKRKFTKVDLLLVSPYLRTVETAEIFKKIVPVAAVKPEPGLEPAATGSGFGPAAMAKKITSLKKKVVAIIGHEPDLGLLVSQLLTKKSGNIIKFKKGGVALIEIDGGNSVLKGLWN